MPSLRLLIWNPFISPGGGIRFLASLVPALAHHPDVESIKLAIPDDNDVLATFSNMPSNVEIFGFSRFPMSKLVYYLKDTVRLRFPREINSFQRALFSQQMLSSIINKYQYFQARRLASDCDVLYSPWPHSQEYPKVEIPVVCTYQDAILLDFPEILGGGRSLQEKRLSERWLEGSTVTVLSSDSTKSALRRHFPDIPESKYEIIRHATLPISVQHEKDAPSSVCQQLPEKYFVCVTNISPHKNLSNLLYAWARFSLRDQFPLVIIGYGTHIFSEEWQLAKNYNWQQDNLLGIVLRTGLKQGKHVYGFGYVSDLDAATILKSATALIMPSLVEGGGSYPVEESLNFGIPVLCSDIPVMHEHLSERSADIVWFDPLSVESIVQALYNFLNNQDEYIVHARHAVEDNRSSWDDIAGNYVRTFQKAINMGVSKID